MNISETIHEAYQNAIEDVWYKYEYKCSPRGQLCREILDYKFKVLNPVSEPIITADEKRNKVIADYTANEISLYESCTNKVADFAKASKFWNQLVNPDMTTINSAYGFLIWSNKSCGNIFESQSELTSGDNFFVKTIMRSPWQWCLESLIADKDTRQAMLRFSLPEHQWIGNKDQVCTLHGMFNIRDDKLNLSIVMRSNDLMRGLVYDLPWFVGLIYQMVEELKPYYPDLQVGSYTHEAHSMHIYERDQKAILRMINNQ